MKMDKFCGLNIFFEKQCNPRTQAPILKRESMMHYLLHSLFPPKNRSEQPCFTFLHINTHSSSEMYQANTLIGTCSQIIFLAPVRNNKFQPLTVRRSNIAAMRNGQIVQRDFQHICNVGNSIARSLKHIRVIRGLIIPWVLDFSVTKRCSSQRQDFPDTFRETNNSCFAWHDVVFMLSMRSSLSHPISKCLLTIMTNKKEVPPCLT